MWQAYIWLSTRPAGSPGSRLGPREFALTRRACKLRASCRSARGFARVPPYHEDLDFPCAVNHPGLGASAGAGRNATTGGPHRDRPSSIALLLFQIS